MSAQQKLDTWGGDVGTGDESRQHASSDGLSKYLEEAKPTAPNHVHLARYLDGVASGKYEITRFFQDRYPDAPERGARAIGGDTR